MTSLDTVRARFVSNAGLPFAEVLTEASIVQILDEHQVEYRDRLFNPITTIWGFLSQVLSDDHSCRDAVSRVVAHRAASGLEPCSPNAASYCNARKRLPTAVLHALAKRTAGQLQDGLPQQWKWNGRDVFIADGSHVSMPDTAENQEAYPQVYNQQPGIGFPLARLAVLLSLASGACHDLAIAPYAGKGTGETTLLRQMYDSLQPGDVVLADALFDNYFLVCALLQRGVDIVARVQAQRVGSQTVQSRPDGDIILWQRPNKPRGMTGEQYRHYPETLTVRQVSVDARGKGNRVEQFKVNHDPRRSDRRPADRRAVRAQVARGGRYPLDQSDDEDGHPALQDTPDGPEGDLGAPFGVQPAAHGHGGGRQRERHGASRAQLQGGQAGRDSVRGEDRSGAARGPWGVGRCDDQGHRVPPGGQPAGALGAAGAETKAQAEQASEPAPPRCQAGAEPGEVVLADRFA